MRTDGSSDTEPIYGINMVILEILRNDITANVRFICPTNSYASTKFLSKRKTIILIKDGDYYEPLGIYFNNQTDAPTFKIGLSNYDNDAKTIRTGIKKILELVKKIMTKCTHHNSMPLQYKMERNVTLKEFHAVPVHKKPLSLTHSTLKASI